MIASATGKWPHPNHGNHPTEAIVGALTASFLSHTLLFPSGVVCPCTQSVEVGHPPTSLSEYATLKLFTGLINVSESVRLMTYSINTSRCRQCPGIARGVRGPSAAPLHRDGSYALTYQQRPQWHSVPSTCNVESCDRDSDYLACHGTGFGTARRCQSSIAGL